MMKQPDPAIQLDETGKILKPLHIFDLPIGRLDKIYGENDDRYLVCLTDCVLFNGYQVRTYKLPRHWSLYAVAKPDYDPDTWENRQNPLTHAIEAPETKPIIDLHFLGLRLRFQRWPR